MRPAQWVTPAALLIAFLSCEPVTAEDKWVEVRTPRFTVVSDAGKGDARKIAKKFEQFRAVLLRVTRSTGFRGERPVLVFAAKDEKTFQTLLPAYWEQKGAAKPAGIFVAGFEQHFAALNLKAQSEFAAQARQRGAEANPNSAVFHEYTHIVLQSNHLPLWLNEGLADFYGNSRIDGKGALFGMPNPFHLLLLRAHALLPLETLLTVDRTSQQYRHENLAGRFYAQSWGLVHFLRVGEQGALRSRLTAYRTAIEEGLDSLSAGRKAFGDLKAFQESFSAYVRGSKFYQERVQIAIVIDEKGWTDRKLSSDESAVLIARLHVQLQRPIEAAALLDRALATAPNSASAYEVRGLLQLRQQKREDAVASFKRSIELGSKSPVPPCFMAAAELNRGRRAGAEVANLESSRVERVEAALAAQALLEPVVARYDTFAPAFSLLAEAYLQQDRPEPALKVAEQAIQMDPDGVEGYLVAGRVLLRLNQGARALVIGRRAVALADTDDERRRAEDLVSGAEKAAEGAR
jgi:tetratricopeptide (TPR) repeat protein